MFQSSMFESEKLGKSRHTANLWGSRTNLNIETNLKYKMPKIHKFSK